MKIVIEDDFLLISGNVQSLLSMKEMIENGLDISVKARTITHYGEKKGIQMKIVFLIHYWEPTDMNFVLYTENELHPIHRTFGHPSARKTEYLLNRS